MAVEHCSCTLIGCVEGVVLKLLDQALLSRNSQVCVPFVGDSLFSSGIGPRTSEAILVILVGAKSKLYLAYTDDFCLASLMSTASSSCCFLNSVLPWYMKPSNTWAKQWRLCSVVFSSSLPVLARTLSLHSRRLSSALPSFASRSLIKYDSFFIISVRMCYSRHQTACGAHLGVLSTGLWCFLRLMPLFPWQLVENQDANLPQCWEWSQKSWVWFPASWFHLSLDLHLWIAQFSLCTCTENNRKSRERENALMPATVWLGSSFQGKTTRLGNEV